MNSVNPRQSFMAGILLLDRAVGFLYIIRMKFEEFFEVCRRYFPECTIETETNYFHTFKYAHIFDITGKKLPLEYCYDLQTLTIWLNPPYDGKYYAEHTSDIDVMVSWMTKYRSYFAPAVSEDCMTVKQLCDILNTVVNDGHGDAFVIARNGDETPSKSITGGKYKAGNMLAGNAVPNYFILDIDK